MKATKSLTFVDWPVSHVQAFTTSRLSPFALPAPIADFASFASFNLGDHVGDDLSTVKNNRRSLQQFLPKNTKIQWLTQVHGAKVIKLTEFSDIAIEADAIITKEKNIALSVMTADCLPILLADGNGAEIAAIHGGWRPLSLAIIAKTLAKMTTPVDNIYAWLGPCIGAKVFEVGGEVKQAFIVQSASFEAAFKVSTNQHCKVQQKAKFLADLHLIANIQLQQLGVKNITTLKHCTFSMEQHYYSYRREQRTGRMAAIICRL